MKKKSRFLTGLLSAVMALSLFALPAAADETTASTQYPTIAQTTGSLKIIKSEKENGEGTPTPLEGVTFTLYKVANIEQNVDASNAIVSLDYTPVNALQGQVINSETKYDGAFKKAVDDARKAGTLPPAEDPATTDGSGIATFTDVPIGVYLVVETGAPSQVVSKTANFLVSIPMTVHDTAEDGTVLTTAHWVYDITAEPKNTTVYGGITLKKYGKNLSAEGTDEDTTNYLNGAKFVLQQKQDNNTWKTLTQNDNKAIGTDGYVVTAGEGVINVTDLQPGTYRFVEVSAPDGYISDGSKTYEFTIAKNDEGNLTYTIPEAIKDESAADGTPTIKVINEKPDLKKQVKDAHSENYVDASDYSIGDVINWKVTATIPNTIKDLETFTLTDTMSAGLTWVSVEAADLKVYADGTLLTKSTNGVGGDYVLTPPAGGTWQITFTDAGKAKMVSKKLVTVTFNTTLNTNAKIGKVDNSAAGNLNDASLKYSNGVKPSIDIVPGAPNPGEYEEKDQAVVYTFKVEVIKVDGKDSTKVLQGAKFTLYKETTSDDENVITAADAKALGLPDEGKYWVAAATITTGEDGKADVSGLKQGTYYLVETEAPVIKNADGTVTKYNLLKTAIKVEVTADYGVKKTVTKNEDGTVVSSVIEVVKFNDNDNTGKYTITVKNNTGFDLPVTGGFGTLLFSCIGALLVVGGVGVLMSTKKKKGNT